MKKQLVGPFAVLLCLLLFGCTKSDTIHAAMFAERYSEISRSTLSLTQALITDVDGEHCYFWTVGEQMGLRLFCMQDGSVAECRVFLARQDSDKGTAPLTEEVRQTFTIAAVDAAAAMCRLSFAEAGARLEPLEIEAMLHQETSRETQTDFAPFYARMLVTDAEYVVVICNQWLRPQEPSEKPESRPAFDETTGIRTETVPHE